MTPRPPAVRAALAAVAALLTAGMVGWPVTAGQAAPVGSTGYCRDGTGVTVVVDFSELGGGVVVGCAQITSGTGLDALRAAGFGYEGVRRWGDGFVCRLAGRPAATEQLPLNGHPGYQEQCLDTPPTAAYWSYWYASNGGSWSYSQLGAKSRRVVPGGFEGWSFSLNNGGGAPGAAPGRPAAVAPTQPTRPAPSRTTPGAKPSETPRATAPSAARAPDRGQSATGADGQTDALAGQGAKAGGDARPAPRGVTVSTPTRRATAPPTRETEERTTPSDVGSAGEQAAVAPVAGSGGIPVGTMVGAALLTFLVTAGAGTAWARRGKR